MFKFRLRRKTKIIIALFLLVATIIGSVVYYQNYLQKQKLAAFNNANILVTAKTPLQARFLDGSTVETFSYEIELQNLTDSDYKIELTGGVVEQSKLESPASIMLSAKATSLLKINLPLKLVGERLTLDLQLTTAVNLLFNGTNTATTKYQLPITMASKTDTEIFSIGVVADPSSKKLDYNSNSKPELKYSLNLQNLSDQAISELYYEIDLLTAAGVFVQPLQIETPEAIAANDNKVQTGSFFFNLPPADQLKLGSKQYKLQAKLTGVISQRKFSIISEPSSEFAIHVIGI